MDASRLKVLVVDDSSDSLRETSAVVADAFPGVEVRTATDGRTAIALTAAEHPHVILLDIRMPGIDGFDVCVALKADPRLRHIPIVFLTAFQAEPEIRVRALEVGAEGFITKPVEHAELTAQVRAMAAIHEARDREHEERDRLAEMVAQRTREIEHELVGRLQAEQEMRATNQELMRSRTAMENLLEDLQVEVRARKANEDRLRESEAMLAATGHMARVGGWRIDLETQTLEWTDELYLIHEVGAAFEPTVDAALTFYHPDSQPIITAAVERAVQLGEPFDLELRIVTARGNLRWVHAVGEARRDGDRVLEVAGTFQDITERRRAEEEKELLQDKLLEARKLEAVGRLVGGIAHHFNNALQTMLLNIEMLLASGTDGAASRGKLLDVQQEAKRSAALTAKLLAFARKQFTRPRALDLDAAMATILPLLDRSLGAAIALHWAPGRDLWPIHLDPAQLERILLSLVENARDAIAGAGQVTIEAANASLDAVVCAERDGLVPGDYVRISVADDGCGMDDAIRSRAFEPFYTTKPASEGVGLGLATVHGIVKQNGGDVAITSAPGRGTTVTIWLPRSNGTRPR